MLQAHSESLQCFWSLSLTLSLQLSSSRPLRKTQTHRPHERLLSLESNEAVVLALAGAVKWETSATDEGEIGKGRKIGGEGIEEFDVVRRRESGGICPLSVVSQSFPWRARAPAFHYLPLSRMQLSPDKDTNSLRVPGTVDVDHGAEAGEVLVEQVFRDGRRMHPQAVSRPSRRSGRRRSRGGSQLLLVLVL